MSLWNGKSEGPSCWWLRGPGTGTGWGRWLERAGYEVMVCPGPQEEEHDCLGLRGGRCPLAFGADVVVLDMGPGDDVSGPVLPGWRLLDLYSRWQLPLVVVVPWGVVITEDPVIAVNRPAARDELLGAVDRSLSGRFVAEEGAP